MYDEDVCGGVVAIVDSEDRSISSGSSNNVLEEGMGMMSGGLDFTEEVGVD